MPPKKRKAVAEPDTHAQKAGGRQTIDIASSPPPPAYEPEHAKPSAPVDAKPSAPVDATPPPPYQPLRIEELKIPDLSKVATLDAAALRNASELSHQSVQHIMDRLLPTVIERIQTNAATVARGGGTDSTTDFFYGYLQNVIQRECKSTVPNMTVVANALKAMLDRAHKEQRFMVGSFLSVTVHDTISLPSVTVHTRWR